MRAGGCSLQQALTGEAAGIVKQAVVVAKRRGHAQVTPLHVANTMLAASGGLLGVACQKSHSHPLQCKALELCFNVALNRLPASSSSPMLAHHNSQYPSISNALAAAFKRAQAHQRRGSVENQQQSLLAVKIEVEQLIISILDDPSVSRVMREAGFSSTQVKTNLEKVVSLELCSESPITSQAETKLIKKPTAVLPESVTNDDDVNMIIETLLMSRNKKSLVMVGECISSIENTVKKLMDRVDKGRVPEGLREVKFISIPPLYSFCNLEREIVEHKIGELACLVKSLVGKGVVLYLGDLNWISEYRINLEQERSYYCSVEHVIMEVGKIVYGINNGEIGRFWLMGVATFQTYMKCTTGYHSLQTVWQLYPITIPANSLGLTLIYHSDEEANLSCSGDCSSKFEAEAENLQTNDPTLSSLPPWLKDQSGRHNDENCDLIRELSKKWNSYCSSANKQSLEKTLTFSSVSPSSSTCCFSFDKHNPNLQQIHLPLPKSAFCSNIPSSSTPSSSSSDMIINTIFSQKFKEFNAQNLNIICDGLEKKVPWQREIVPEIAGTVLQCRSGMLRRKDKGINGDVKEETWLFFLGPDAQAKQKISRHLAKIVFGSYSNFISIGMSSSTRSDSSIERFCEAMSGNPHRVFLVEDLEQADYRSQMGIKRAIVRGRISNGSSGEDVSLCDAIIILSSERLSSSSGAPEQNTEEETSPCFSLDLNVSSQDDIGVEKHFIDDLGILENVDKCVNFKTCREH